MLQFPYDQPIVPMVRYDGVMPPYVPVCPLPPQLENIRAMLAAAVANESAEKAPTGYARMYCYNALSSNGWNNPYFAECVQLSAQYVGLQLAKQSVHSAEYAVPNSVSMILTMYTSNLLLQIPELKAVCHPNQVNAAYQNAPQFENLKREISQMYGYHNTQTHGHQVMPHQQQQTMYPAQYPQHQGHHPNMLPNAYPSTPHGHPQHHPQNMMMNAMMRPGQPIHTHSSSMSGFSMQDGRPSPVQEATPNDRFAGRPSNRRFERNSQPVPQPQMQHPGQVAQPGPRSHRQVPSEAPKEVVKETYELQFEQGVEMDRERHKLAYFGQAYVQDPRPRTQQFTKSLTDLTSTDQTAVDKVVDRRPVMISSLDDAIAVGQTELYKKSSTGVTIHRQFVFVARAIMSGIDQLFLWDEIQTATSLSIIARKISSIAKAAEADREENKNNPEHDLTKGDRIINFLTELDNKITSLINDFLRINLQLDTMQIDSFVEDFDSVEGHLQKTYGPKEAAAFNRFSRELFSILKSEPSDDCKQSVRELHDLEEDVPLICETYSITHVFLNSRELGYRLGKDPVKVNQRTAPNLHSILTTLSQQKYEGEFQTVRDLLVSSDGVVYKVYQDYRFQGEYLISL